MQNHFLCADTDAFWGTYHVDKRATDADIKKRAVYQAGYIWGQLSIRVQGLPSPPGWGCEESSGQWLHCWTNLLCV